MLQLLDLVLELLKGRLEFLNLTVQGGGRIRGVLLPLGGLFQCTNALTVLIHNTLKSLVAGLEPGDFAHRRHQRGGRSGGRRVWHQGQEGMRNVMLKEPSGAEASGARQAVTNHSCDMNEGT